jgi:hypothetical protein
VDPRLIRKDGQVLSVIRNGVEAFYRQLARDYREAVTLSGGNR